jgi:undecaprenyl-diphosphatase
VTLIQSLILGIIQGLTEFLPISSSAHLVLVPYLFGWHIPEAQVFPFDVLVQLGTLMAVIIYFWKDLWAVIKGFFKALVDKKPFGSVEARLGWYLILATIPAGLAGMLIKDKVEAAFSSVTATALFLFLTALLLVLAEVFGKRTRELPELNWLDALVIGVFQILSLFPGVSRSGSTIAGGMFRKLDRSSAARFSFLMSIPVMLGAGALSLKDALEMPGFSDFLPVLIVGFLAALLVGYLVIHLLLEFLKKRSLYVFAIYCVLVGAFVLVLGLIRQPVSANALPAEPTAAVSVTTATDNTQSVAAISADPAQNPLTVTYTPALAWTAPVMKVCTDSIPGLAIVTMQVPAAQIEAAEAAVKLRWGAPQPPPVLAYQLGNEELALAVNVGNPLTTLSKELVSQIYGGQLRTWGEVYTQCPDCFASPPAEDFQALAINTLSYSSQEEPQVLFVIAFTNGQPVLNPAGILVPTSAAMQAEIEKDPAAIGFAGAHSLGKEVRQIALSGMDDQSVLASPLLALTAEEPNAALGAWLACIQKVIAP